MRSINTVVNGRPAQVAVKPFYKHERLIISIDPDSDKNGVAVIVGGEIEELRALDYFDLNTFLVAKQPLNPLILLEDVDNSKPTWPSGAKRAIRERRSRDVGKVQMAARQIRKLLEHLSLEYLLVTPLEILEKRRSKTDGQFFNDLTGWHGRTNADKRDAAILGLDGLPDDYSICPDRHVFTGGRCQACALAEATKRRRAVKRKAAAQQRAAAAQAIANNHP